MSKWVNTEKFDEFREERAEDKTPESNQTFARKWRNPAMGTQAKPNEYQVRMLPDPEGNFYKKYFYHMFKSGESWSFIMCPKTNGMDEYCPWCAITQLLYQGSTADKKKAAQYKRKEKYVGNTYIVKDPRDANESDSEKHYTGKTFLYEFPAVVEGQIKKEITDTENGWGPVIFDPEEGHNLILRIGAKKADANGKSWPDYSQTTFTKKPSPITEDGDIEEIMDTCQSISEYLEASAWTAERHEELLKSEMIWDDVEDEFLRHMKAAEAEEKVKEKAAPKKEATPDPDKEAHNEKKETPKKEEVEDQTDQDLLAELENL
jgi:hypothetical protein